MHLLVCQDLTNLLWGKHADCQQGLVPQVGVCPKQLRSAQLRHLVGLALGGLSAAGLKWPLLCFHRPCAPILQLLAALMSHSVVECCCFCSGFFNSWRKRVSGELVRGEEFSSLAFLRSASSETSLERDVFLFMYTSASFHGCFNV